MKIKNVEIYNFRAFSDVTKATFDFTKDGEILDFVSIYAPNGFGKTSFYDAVEWCVTEQIERFHKNASEFDKVGKENRKGNTENPFFLQHKGTSDLGYVKINTDSVNYSRKLTNSKVYNFKTKATNIFFRDVILSQDLIDTFIKEEKADDRYKKFIQSFPNLAQYNSKLENIVRLIEYNSNKINNDLKPEKDKLNGVQLKIDFQGDNKVVEEINNSIQFLISNNEKLNLIIPETTTEQDFQLLHNKVNSELINLESSLNEKKDRIVSIDDAYKGSATDDSYKLGIYNYFDSKDRIKIQENELKFLKDYKSKINKSEDLIKFIDYQKERSEQNTKIKGFLENYLIFQSEIEKANSEIKKNNSELITYNEEIKSIQKNIQEDTNTLQSFNNELISNQNKLNNISLNENRLKEINTELEEILLAETKLNNKKTEQKSLLQKIELTSYHYSLINSEISLLKDIKDYTIQKENILQIEKLNVEIEKLDKEKHSIELQINKQKELKNDLNEFITKGLEIIHDNHTNFCPLCNQEYQSFEILTKKILNNSFIEENLRELLEKASNIETSISETVFTQDELIKTLQNFLTEILNRLEEENSKNNQEISAFSEKISNKDILLQEKNQILLFFENINPNNFEQHISTKITELFSQIKNTEKNIEDNKKNIQTLDQKIKTLNENIVRQKEQIENIQKEILYIEVNRYFLDILNSESIDLELLNNENNEIKDLIDSNRKSLNEIQKEKKEIESKLQISNLSLEQINSQINNLTDVISLNKKPVSDFEQFINSAFNISLYGKNKIEADNVFDILRKAINNDIQNIQEKIKHYSIIDKLRESTLSYLTLEKTRKDISKINYEISVLEKIQTDLEKEKISLEDYLKKEIDNFFYTDLISAIYRKIDPHPDYNNIEFNCDFNDTQPRLQIYTTDRNGRTSVPALYFSSAQINILSLSIFLARALNAKDDKGNPIDCIFIDDPIQSMDSINILSFIDLFRSIIVNLKKQIIVSTHEENFHSLLQKKIPENLFKSKFIEFETFGKLAI